MEFGQRLGMRVTRSILLSGSTAAAAGVAHVVGGGHMGSPWLLAALALLGSPLVFALSAQRWTFPRIVAFMGMAQMALHAAMSLAGSHTAAHTASHFAAHETSQAGVGAGPLGASHSGHVVTLSDAIAGADTVMALTHLAATLVLAAAIAYGERAVAWTFAILAYVVALDATPTLAFRAPVFARMSRPRSAEFVRRRPSRAPPVSFVSA